MAGTKRQTFVQRQVSEYIKNFTRIPVNNMSDNDETDNIVDNEENEKEDEYEENSVEKYKTDERVSFGLLTADRSGVSSFMLDNGETVKTLVKTFQEMKGDKNHFTVKEHLKVEIDGDVFFDKVWENVIPRKYV